MLTRRPRLNGGVLGLVRDALQRLERKKEHDLKDAERLVSFKALCGDMEQVLLKESKGEKLLLAKINDLHRRARALLAGKIDKRQ